MALEMKYFVLNPSGKDTHAEASRAAMREYARVIQTHDEAMMFELIEWANKEEVRARKEQEEEHG